MSLIFYRDDFNIVEIETPPIKSVTDNYSFQKSANYSFVVQSKEVWQRISNFIRIRNNQGIRSEGVNINGKSTGWYTCAVQDVSTGDLFYARIDIDTAESSNTRFWDCQGWNNTGREMTIRVTEVEV